MCLAIACFAYGDCAIVPDPTPEQLAGYRDLLGAHRRPVRHRPTRRDAVLPTGTSGTGADVDKVRRQPNSSEREPALLVEGPIQYDAAVEPSVAVTKMPDSPVAGRVTVLDLSRT